MDDKTRLAQLEALIVAMLQRQDRLEALVAELQEERLLMEQRLQKLEAFVEAQQAAGPVAHTEPAPLTMQLTLAYLLSELRRLPHHN